MQLTTNFSIAELTASQVGTRKGIDNTPAPAVVSNLARVAAMLEQIRALVGGPISVSSGYRSPALNRAVGGAANSAHVLGLAADINAPGMTPRTLALLIREGCILYDQLIYEGTWVHVGLAAGAQRNQVLTAQFAGGRATYVQGIV